MTIEDEHPPEGRPDRLSTVASEPLSANSLVGSFFHSDATRRWQGCVVAEVAPMVFLVELFDRHGVSSSAQQIVHLQDMAGWQFYDTAQRMINTYEYGGLRERWDAIQEAKEDG